MTQPSAEWRSGQRVGLITQRSQDRNLALLFMLCWAKVNMAAEKNSDSGKNLHLQTLVNCGLHSKLPTDREMW